MSIFKYSAFADEAGTEVDKQIEGMKRNGISLMEIRGTEYGSIADISMEQTKEIHKKLEDNGLGVWSIGSPSGKINIDDNDNMEHHYDQYKGMLDKAAILGAKHFRLFSFYHTNGDTAYKDEVCEKMQRFVDLAKGYDIVLCHENEKGIYGDTPEKCIEIHKAVSGIKAVYDPANFVQCGCDPVKSFEIVAPYIEYIHIKDSKQNGDVVPAGTGDSHIDEIIKKYAAMGGGTVTFEPHLWEFSSLKALEEEGNTSGVGGLFSSQTEAFDVGFAHLKKILDKYDK